MTKNIFREQSPYEIRVLQKLFSLAFHGHSALEVQLSVAKVREIDEDGSLEFQVPAGIPLVEVRNRIPVEAEVRDIDGTKIHILLHVVHGKVSELELFREDGTRVLARPDPDALEVLCFD